MSPLLTRHQTFKVGNMDIHVRMLKDKHQHLDDGNSAEKYGISYDTWPLFGVVWESGEVLAHLMLDYEVTGKRILEVGCGIALASLVLNRRQADITATDYHPEAGNFLLENVQRNQGANIPFVRAGWGEKDCALGRFDLIVGSDLLYEENSVELLSGFIDRHAQPQCEVIIVDPGRGLTAGFSRKMLKLGYSYRQVKLDKQDSHVAAFHGHILQYQR
jgi:predicted nicotinamide N-methyase